MSVFTNNSIDIKVMAAHNWLQHESAESQTAKLELLKPTINLIIIIMKYVFMLKIHYITWISREYVLESETVVVYTLTLHTRACILYLSRSRVPSVLL